jgi:hypothetical protein
MEKEPKEYLEWLRWLPPYLLEPLEDTEVDASV